MYTLTMLYVCYLGRNRFVRLYYIIEIVLFCIALDFPLYAKIVIRIRYAGFE